jgi:asparaginyl-tRNA synthetase
MKQRIKIADLIKSTPINTEVTVKGWVRTFRNNQFLTLNDGSTLQNIQCVIDFENTPEFQLKRLTTSAAVSVFGTVVESSGSGQNVEIQVNSFEILGDSDADKYPIQLKNRPSLEFLRENAHLRMRTNTFSAIMRMRSTVAFAVHQYFFEKGFYYINTPIITGSDAEGAGEMFKVTQLDLHNLPKNEDGSINYKEDFFGKETNLTVSGQLEAETFAMALGQVYTFGPTFRAENSNTSRHLAEFWMIEPEVAFNDLADNMDLAEDFIKYVIKFTMVKHEEDLKFLNQRLIDEEKQKPQAERSELTLLEKLNFVLENNFKRVTYTEAVDILRNSKPNKNKKFNYIIEEWGADLQSEHERFLVEKHFKCPVILYDYPAKIKAFYMRLNDNTEQGKETVRAMDILFPGIGEIVGGSQREERHDVLVKKMQDLGIPEEELWWYIDTRKFGTATHAGFGMGFERLLLFITGMTNIRDVIPFPRTPQNAEF